MRRVYPITRNPKEQLTDKTLIFYEYEIMALFVLNPSWFVEEDGSPVKPKENEYIIEGFDLKYYIGTYEEIKEMCRKWDEEIKNQKNVKNEAKGGKKWKLEQS